MQRSLIAALAVLVLAGIGAAMYVTLRPAPAGTPTTTSTAPVATSTPEASAPTPPVEVAATGTPSETLTPTSTATTTGFKTYRNEEWGFAFEYPADWEVRTPAFGSAVSLFNLTVEPIDPYNLYAILVNITPKEWIINAHIKMRNRGVAISETELNGKRALFAEDREGAGGPTKNYYILINDEYWIHLSGQMRQEQVFDRLVESFDWL